LSLDCAWGGLSPQRLGFELGRRQVAELLAVRTSWVYEAVRTNRLRCLRIGRHIRFIDMLEKWLREQAA
jgi:excisionase family DNA binding protein